uniref:bactericidal permeability-increasing protein-like n=1 Tax=Centroberyx gerrardi TaxID=166262 RepID=UPI003AAB4960
MLSSLVLLLILTAHSYRETPAMKLILTKKTLQYGSQLGTQWMRQKVQSVSIPQVQGSVSLGLLGNVDYVLSGMTVTRCILPEPSVQFDEGTTGLQTAVTGLSIWVRGRWNTHYGLIHDGGSFDLSLSNIRMSSAVKLGSDYMGHLTISSAFCSAQISGITINVQGGGSPLFKPFVDRNKGQIKGQIEGKICPEIRRLVEDLTQHLTAMDVSVSVSHNLIMELPLTSAPSVQSSILHLDFKGEFYNAQHHTEPTFQAKPFTLNPHGDYMLHLGLSEFSVNSASYAYFSAGLLQAQINDSMIPPSSPFQLNTSFFGVFIPQLPKMFPNMLMGLHVVAREVPMFRFTSDEVDLGLLASVKAFAIHPNKTLVPLFKLNVNSSFVCKVFFSQGKMRGSAMMNTVTLALASSEVGIFQTTSLENVMKIGMKMMFLPKLNAKLSEGMVLPSFHQFHLDNPVVKVEVGFVAISSDVTV